MKVETVVALPEDLLTAMDAWAEKYGSRAELIEAAVEDYIKRLERQERTVRDVETINRHADALNEEVMESLEYQSAREMAANEEPESRQEVSAYDLVKDLIGCLEDGPPDLSTNKKYMEGFGESRRTR